MYKQNKKIFLYITLIPYIFVLSYVLNFTFKNLKSGIDCIGDAFANVLEFFIFDYTVLGVLMVALMVYQLYYLVSECGPMVKRIFLGISFSVWIWYFVFSISRYWLGHTFLFHTTYGFEAIYEALILNLIFFSIIPILPLTFIYIVFYILHKIKNKRKT